MALVRCHDSSAVVIILHFLTNKKCIVSQMCTAANYKHITNEDN